jgi:hypothetical protein
MKGKTESVHVKKRKCMAQHVGFGDFPYLDYILGIMNKVRTAPLGFPVVPEV